VRLRHGRPHRLPEQRAAAADQGARAQRSSAARARSKRAESLRFLFVPLQGHKKITPFFIPYAITNMGGALLAIELGFMARLSLLFRFPFCFLLFVFLFLLLILFLFTPGA
jgi:hypothetical protein